MSVTIGTQLGSYKITALLGKGGMGEVYRAHDTKLKRDVAIKILPEEFSRDPERVSRFQREAEALAALNHQNIAGIYDLQQSGTTRFLVLEFVEGDTLAEILKKRGALPLDDTLNIAKQICEALEAAHEKSIIHRDLKPANIKVMADGKVKVLDFGLAKAMEREPTNASLSNSPTLSMAATNAGIILGTAAYMSPEQAKGRTVEKRTDIFAFGAVLFEMPLAGTEGAASPFWSPDSRSVGFFADSKLKRLDIGGATQTLATVTAARGGTWNADGLILFTPTSGGPLFRVPASGGQAVAVTKLDRQTSHRFPSFLPDGRQFLFYAQGTLETAGIYLGSLDSAETPRLTAADTAGVYLSSGWLLWVRAGTLVAQRLDLERKVLTGDPVTLADPVAFDSANAVAVSVSAAGLVAYRTGGATRRQLAWFDRSGKALGALGAPDENDLSAPRLSPDGRRVAVSRAVQGNSDIWILDGTRTNRFTFDAAPDRYPIWSPDGRRIVFDSSRKGHRDLYQKPSSGAGVEELLVESPQDKIPNDWSADGRFILYHSFHPQTARDLWVLPMEGDRKPWVFLKTSFDERYGQFSPDGRWVAYMSSESGRPQIYIRPFAAPAASGAAANPAAGQWQVSTAGGIFPRWRPDGKELYYIGPNGEMMAAPIAATGTTLEPSAPVALFPTRIFSGGVDNAQGRQYDVTRDGRFLINTVLDEAATSPITLILNWHPEQKK